MKKILFAALFLLSFNSNAWYGSYGPYGMMPYGMYGGYGYGMGYMYPPLQVPSFNYQTTVIQQPAPIIVQQQPQVIYRESPPQVIYKEVCNEECERLRKYFGKK